MDSLSFATSVGIIIWALVLHKEVFDPAYAKFLAKNMKIRPHVLTNITAMQSGQPLKLYPINVIRRSKKLNELSNPLMHISNKETFNTRGMTAHYVIHSGQSWIQWSKSHKQFLLK